MVLIPCSVRHYGGSYSFKLILMMVVITSWEILHRAEKLATCSHRKKVCIFGMFVHKAQYLYIHHCRAAHGVLAKMKRRHLKNNKEARTHLDVTHWKRVDTPTVTSGTWKGQIYEKSQKWRELFDPITPDSYCSAPFQLCYFNSTDCLFVGLKFTSKELMT